MALVVHTRDLFGALDEFSTYGDLPTFVNAVNRAWAGMPVYAPPQAAAPDHILSGPSMFPYPPSTLLLLSPLAALHGSALDWTWLGVHELSLGLLLWLVYWGLGRPSKTEALTAVTLVLLFFPVRHDIFEGQLNIIVTTFLVASVVALQRRRELLGGGALAAAVALKLTPLALVPFFLWRRAPRMMIATAGVILAIFLATLVVGWGRLWLPSFAETAALGQGTAFLANQSLNGFLRRLWDPSQNGQPAASPPAGFLPVWYGLELLLAIGTALLVWRVRMPEPLRLWVQFAIVTLGVTLLLPISWFHHFVPGVVAILVGVRLVWDRAISAAAAAALVAAYGLSSFVAPVVHNALRPSGYRVFVGAPGLQILSSATFLGALLALVALASARVRPEPH